MLIDVYALKRRIQQCGGCARRREAIKRTADTVRKAVRKILPPRKP